MPVGGLFSPTGEGGESDWLHPVSKLVYEVSRASVTNFSSIAQSARLGHFFVVSRRTPYSLLYIIENVLEKKNLKRMFIVSESFLTPFRFAETSILQSAFYY